MSPRSTLRVLVIQQDPEVGLGYLQRWLTEFGAETRTLRADDGESIPSDLVAAACDAIIVLGGTASSCESPGPPWFTELRRLLVSVVDQSIPTFAICLGAQQLAQAHGGAVRLGVKGIELGVAPLTMAPAAEEDRLMHSLTKPLLALEWHEDEICRLPRDAVLLASSPMYRAQVFRIGATCWGVQAHPEIGRPEVETGIALEGDFLAAAGTDGARLRAEFLAAEDQLHDSWQEILGRFLTLAHDRHVPEPRRD